MIKEDSLLRILIKLSVLSRNKLSGSLSYKMCVDNVMGDGVRTADGSRLRTSLSSVEKEASS